MTRPLAAAIVAGGRGARLAGITGGGPKALAPFGGGTLLDHQLRRLSVLDPCRVVVLAGHGGAAVAEAAGDRAEVQVEVAPMGTAGALAHLPPEPEAWLVVNVDHVSDVDLVALARGWRPPCTAVLAEVAVPVDEGVADVQGDRVVAVRERPVLRLPVTTGLYLFQRSALARHLDGTPCDMPALLGRLLAEGVYPWRHPGTWFDAGTPDRLAAAEAWWAWARGGPG